MTHTARLLALLALLTLAQATPAHADASVWAVSRLRTVLSPDGAKRVSSSGRWLDDQAALFGAFLVTRVNDGEFELRFAHARSDAQAAKIVADFEQAERRSGGKFATIDADGQRGFRILRPGSGAEHELLAVVAQGPKVAWVRFESNTVEGAKDVLRTCVERVLQAFHTAALPETQERERAKTSAHLWQVKNDTQAALTLTIQVTERGQRSSKIWRIEAGQTVTLKIPPGDNFVTAVSDLPNVNPFLGVERQDRGYKTSCSFYIRSRGQ